MRPDGRPPRLVNTHGSTRRLILFGLVIFGAWYMYAHWWPRHNLRMLGGRIENSVNHRLVSLGITDTQVISEVHHERSRWGQVWVETERKLQWPPGRSLVPLQTELKAVAEEQDLRFTSIDQQGSTTITLAWGPLVFQRLILLQKTPLSVPPAAIPEVAFVIDDVAYDMETMDHYAALGVPLTFAILPRDKHSKLLAQKATDMNFPVILHLPMEPIDLAHNDPGGAALYLRMTPQELHEQFERDVASVPHIVGINNHMGSAFTEDESKMILVMRWVKEKHLFFLDSRTSMHSIVPRVAKRMGVPCLVNETFLDNSDDTEAIKHQLDQVLTLAMRHGRTIAIGHYRRKHLTEALAQKIPEFRARGVRLVTLPSLYPGR